MEDDENNLDLLLQELDREVSTSEGEIHLDRPPDQLAQEGEDLDRRSPVTENSPPAQATRTPPIRQQRNRNLEAYISSSSARRRIVKGEHCNYCHRFVQKADLENHLIQSEPCGNLYFRKFKVRTMDGLMLKLYQCLFCPTKSKKLLTHLGSSPNCLDKYSRRFNVDSVEELKRKILNLRRQSQKSRQSLERRFENEEAKKKKEDFRKTRPNEVSLNIFELSVAFSNFKKCCICSKNLLVAQGEEVTVDSDAVVAGKVNWETAQSSRRFNKLWKCKKDCSQNGVLAPTVRISREMIDGNLIIVPISQDNNGDIPDGNTEVNNNAGVEQEQDWANNSWYVPETQSQPPATVNDGSQTQVVLESQSQEDDLSFDNSNIQEQEQLGGGDFLREVSPVVKKID